MDRWTVVILLSSRIDLVIDSSGLAIFGEVEWAGVKHGERGVRRWQKLHLGVDGDGVIVGQVLTASANHAKQPEAKTFGMPPNSRSMAITVASLAGVVDNLATNDRGDDLGSEDLVLGHG